MATLSYATTGTGVIAGGLGWINFGSLTLAPGSSVTNQTATLKDGSVLKFDISNTAVSAGGATVVASPVPTFGGAPFGVVGYTGVTGNVALYTNGNTASTKITLSNISVTDPLGKPVPYYTIYIVDAEASATGESIVSTTDGGVWNLLTKVGTGPSPTLTGTGTQTVNYTGAAGSFNAPICGTVNPKTVSSTLTEVGQIGRSAIAVGISINKITLQKIITKRFDSSDQFNLTITGASSASTITFGSTLGAQSVSAYVYPETLGNYVLSEVMAPGSSTPLSGYSQTISYTNLTPGGSTVPSPTTIPSNLTLGLADMILATIVNTVIPPTITSTKQTISYTGLNSVVPYTLTFKNNGVVSVNSVKLIDTIPTGTTFETGSLKVNGSSLQGNPSPPNGVIIGTIPAGATYTVTFNVLVGSTLPNPNPFTNNATATFTYSQLPSDGSGTSSTNTVSTKVNDPRINSKKSVTPTNTTVGNVINYTVILSNTGNVTANNVVFIDTIPNGTSFVTNSFAINGTTQTGANPSPPTGVNIPSLALNGVATLTFQVTVDTTPTPNPIPNSSTTNYAFVLNPATGATIASSSNSNTVTTYVNPDSNPLKIVDKQYAVPGDTLTYTVQWENRLSVTATNVVLIDTIPSDTTFVGNSVAVNGTTILGATVAPPNGINVGTIPSGAFTTVTFKVTVTNTIPNTNPIPNQAIGRYSYISDPTLGTITTETAVSNFVSTQINIASIPSATKAVDKVYAKVGDVLTYTLSFTNIGNTTATNVKLIDTIPNDTTFVINSVFVNGVNQPGAVVAPPTGLSVGSLGVNSTATVVFQITVNTVPNPNPIPNRGFVSYNYVIDPIALTNGNGATNTNIVNTQVNYADFGIAEKAVNKTFSNIGDILTYTIVYTNTGNVTANNVIISDTIPNDTAFQASSVIINNTPNTTTVPVGNVLIISAGNVAPGGSATLSFKVNITTAPNPNPIPNSASSSFTYTVDPTLPNGVTGGKNTNTVNTQVNSASLGGITKFVDKAYAICGETITYTISIPNSGNITATNVVLSDTVPNGTSFVTNSILVNGSAVGGTPQSIALGSIAPGATTTVSYIVTVVC